MRVTAPSSGDSTVKRPSAPVSPVCSLPDAGLTTTAAPLTTAPLGSLTSPVIGAPAARATESSNGINKASTRRLRSGAPSDGKRDQRRVFTAAGRDDDELAAEARAIGHRRGVRPARQRQAPHFGAGGRVDGVERRIATAGEDKAAGRGEHAGRAGDAEDRRKRHALQLRMTPQ